MDLDEVRDLDDGIETEEDEEESVDGDESLDVLADKELSEKEDSFDDINLM